MIEKSPSIWKRQFIPGLTFTRLPRLFFRFFRWLFAWQTIRRCLFALACLATLAALFYTEENWRGKHAWEKYRREWEAKGEKFDVQAFNPPPVPDDQNFALTPLLKPLFDYTYNTNGVLWRDTNGFQRVDQISVDPSEFFRNAVPEMGAWSQGTRTSLLDWEVYFRGTNFPPGAVPDALLKKYRRMKDTSEPRDFWPITAQPGEPAADVLSALNKFTPQIEELRRASALPYSRFPIHYDDLEGALLPHLAMLKKISRVLNLRAEAELELEKTEEAYDDVNLSLFFADAIKSDATVISQLVRLAIIEDTLQPIWEGLAAHRWQEKQIQAFQSKFETFDPLSEYDRATKLELAFLDSWIANISGQPDHFLSSDPLDLSAPMAVIMLRWAPRGWACQNELFISRFYRDNVFPFVNVAEQRVYPGLPTVGAAAFQRLPSRPFNVFAKYVADFEFGVETFGSQRKFARAQTDVNLAKIACALELYRLANSQYPETLAALSPRFISALPHDIINGQPLRYRRADDDRFLLYSVGWDEKDDGGVPAVQAAANGANHDSGPDGKPETGDWVWQYPGK